MAAIGIGASLVEQTSVVWVGQRRICVSVPRIVIDTSAFIAAILSRRGAAYRLVLLSESGLFQANVSVPLMLEYEAVAKRLFNQTPLTESDLEDILDFVCATANRQRVFYLWRPSLPDPQDDMVLELAVAAGCGFIVTFNKRHFAGIDQFGIEAVTPQEFLERLGVRR